VLGVGDDAGITGIGFRLAAVSIAGSVYGEAWDIEHPLVSLPQERQQERRATPWLVHCPDNLFGQRESFVYELKDVCFIVFDLPGEQLPPRSVQYVNPVKLLAGICACPGLVSITTTLVPRFSRWPLGESRRELPTLSDTLIADLYKRSRSLLGDKGQFFYSHPLGREILKPSSTPLGIIQDTYLDDHI
jgi:hypothetical protein